MGQRNMTYVITEDKYGEQQIGTIYNQWNHIELQLPKLVRGIKAFSRVKHSCYKLFETFYAAHGLSPESGWVGGFVDDDCFTNGNYDSAFQEDNNNGWNIILIRQDKDDNFSFEICHLLGSEDADDYREALDAVPTDDYFLLGVRDYWNAATKKEYTKALEFLRASAAFNPKLKPLAASLIQKMIHKSSLSLAA